MVPKPLSQLGSLFGKLSPEVLFARTTSPRVSRKVYFNQPLPTDHFDHKGRILKEHVYTTNQVITSKYTVITFLPRNLLEQFRRIANVFVDPFIRIMPLHSRVMRSLIADSSLLSPSFSSSLVSQLSRPASSSSPS
jgi:hypothetical protein